MYRENTVHSHILLHIIHFKVKNMENIYFLLTIFILTICINTSIGVGEVCMKEGKELYCDAGYTCCNQGNGKCCGPDFVCGIDGACIALAYLIFPPIITVFVLLIILCFCCYCCRKDKDKKQALDNEYPFAMNAYPPSHNVPPTGVPLSMISKLNKKTPVTPKPTKPVNKAEQFLGPSPKYRDDSDLPNSPAPPYLQPQGKSKGRHKDIY